MGVCVIGTNRGGLGAHQQYLPLLLAVVLLGAGHGAGLGVAHGTAGLRADGAVVRRPHGGARTVQGQVGDAGGPAVLQGGGREGRERPQSKTGGGVGGERGASRACLAGRNGRSSSTRNEKENQAEIGGDGRKGEICPEKRLTSS